ncbi:MAG: gliding motility-associated C-terminal domain-containing protein [Rudanella sp.]|nr:gliding motility-associated C-terminal domain-containing protein [Rudanella sp.]
MRTHMTPIPPVGWGGMLTDFVRKDLSDFRLGLLVVWASCALLLLGLTVASQAQCTRLGELTGALGLQPTPVGCIPFSITVVNTNVTKTQTNTRFVFEYDGQNETKLTTNPVYTYRQAGVYRLLQLSDMDGIPARTCAVVTVYDTLPPLLSLLSCGSSLTLTVATSPLSPYEAYQIDWGDGQLERVLPAEARNKVHVYSAENTYRIRVKGQYHFVECGGLTTRLFSPGKPKKPPTISRLEPRGQQIGVFVNNEDEGLYVLEQQVGAGIFQPVANGSRATANQLVAPLDTSQVNCFRLVQADPCFPPINYAATCYEPPKPKPPVSTVPVLSWWLPSAFTPNGDGQNDTFGVIGQTDSTNFQLSILNRWSVLVFRTTDPTQAWNGTVSGEPAPVGMYGFYILNGRIGTENNQKSGMVLLVR